VHRAVGKKVGSAPNSGGGKVDFDRYMYRRCPGNSHSHGRKVRCESVGSPLGMGFLTRIFSFVHAGPFVVVTKEKGGHFKVPNM
jgi:hypothetical protein